MTSLHVRKTYLTLAIFVIAIFIFIIRPAKENINIKTENKYLTMMDNNKEKGLLTKLNKLENDL